MDEEMLLVAVLFRYLSQYKAIIFCREAYLLTSSDVLVMPPKDYCRPRHPYMWNGGIYCKWQRWFPPFFLHYATIMASPQMCVGGIFLKGVLSKQKIYVGYEIIIQK